MADALEGLGSRGGYVIRPPEHRKVLNGVLESPVSTEDDERTRGIVLPLIDKLAG